MYLMEREAALGQLAEILAETDSGTGRVAVVSGSAAMGKTALLRWVTQRAISSGMTVLSAVGSPEERCLPYATLEGLIDVPVDAGRVCATMDTESVGVGRAAAIARAARRVVAGMATDGTVVLTVDDIQYADVESLRCLNHLARTLRHSRLAIICTWNPWLHTELGPELRDLVRGANVRRIRAHALSVGGVARLLGAPAEEPGSTAVAARYLQLTGGNPLLINVLRTDARSATPEPGRAFRQAVLQCLHRMGPVP